MQEAVAGSPNGPSRALASSDHGRRGRSARRTLGARRCAAVPIPRSPRSRWRCARRGCTSGRSTGCPGRLTAKGLRSFQRAARLPVTGELGPRTRAELGALGRPLVARRVLAQGTYGWDVSSLQFLLARAGHLRLLDVDGHFGASTKASLVRFQRTRGLGVDGIAGPATLTAFGHGRRTPVLTQATAPAVPVSSYVVRPGDTLTAIAEKHKTTVRALATANDLASVNLVVEGAKLVLPGASGSGSASGPADGAEPLDGAGAHRPLGRALRHPRQPGPGARVAGVRLPDERHVVGRRLGPDAGHPRRRGRSSRPCCSAAPSRGRARAVSRSA